MVSIAFVLLMVSTLAVHGKQVSTDGPIIPRGCEGKSLCDENPADYPQDEIDHFLQNNPAILRRMKREVDLAGFDGCEESQKLMPALEKGSVCGNCNTTITCEEPFLQVETNHLPGVIVKSKFFIQKIRQVRCRSSRAQCFSKLTRKDGPKAKCNDVAVSTKLYVYNRSTQKVENVPGLIYIDCACEYGL